MSASRGSVPQPASHTGRAGSTQQKLRGCHRREAVSRASVPAMPSRRKAAVTALSTECVAAVVPEHSCRPAYGLELDSSSPEFHLLAWLNWDGAAVLGCGNSARATF